MENLIQLLNKTERSLPPSWQVDKSNPPPRENCPCGLPVGWFWLDSDCPGIILSRWIKHLCLCKLIADVSDQLNLAISWRDWTTREVDDNSFTRKYNDRKIELLNGIVSDLDNRKTRMTGLLKDLVALKTLADPNREYLNCRLKLARKYDAWRELFDCRTEAEARELLDALYADGSDKFVEQMEKQMEKIK